MTEYRFVKNLPDLIEPGDYEDQPLGRLVRVRIRVMDDGVEVLGDAFRPAALERLLEELGAGVVEQMLCG